MGTQLVYHRHGKVLYADLLNKFKRKLDGWKAKCLSLAGRITLASSIITSLPIYQMQTSLLAALVFKEIDKSVRKCVWGSKDEHKRFILCDGTPFANLKILEEMGCVAQLK